MYYKFQRCCQLRNILHYYYLKNQYITNTSKVSVIYLHYYYLKNQYNIITITITNTSKVSVIYHITITLKISIILLLLLLQLPPKSM